MIKKHFMTILYLIFWNALKSCFFSVHIFFRLPKGFEQAEQDFQVQVSMLTFTSPRHSGSCSAELEGFINHLNQSLNVYDTINN